MRRRQQCRRRTFSSDQAKETVVRRRRIAPPTMPKPAMSIAQVVGSGTDERKRSIISDVDI